MDDATTPISPDQRAAILETLIDGMAACRRDPPETRDFGVMQSAYDRASRTIGKPSLDRKGARAIDRALILARARIAQKLDENASVIDQWRIHLH